MEILLLRRLQQYLPFTVLKLKAFLSSPTNVRVATVLTVYGIETRTLVDRPYIYKTVATVLTVYGIETMALW